ncbi:GAF domain-containing protein [Gluconobacter wancherniae]|uniref:GAF domain-containing protein n=1 Tax=Gluconobacter wancherniae TaxID=1307955 RepID=UPI001B8CD9B3|nr:GAF domain-containing protein [Gluconobacter wancherniae]MBS1062541.1 GAF domain-containing protein [Gluconobacter wancherniae]MBS1094679.1 GAF domain-containing protein [Gluconobacter wancherniae]
MVLLPNDILLSESWSRCSTVYGLNPSVEWETTVLSAPEIRYLCDRHRPLIQAAAPEMDRLHTLVRGLGFVVLLADANGYILARRIQPEAYDRCRRWRLQIGALWDEATAGTNGIGTCLSEGKPIIITQEQHWRFCFRPLTGLGVPLFGAQGQLSGVLDLSALPGTTSEPFALLLMDALQTAACRLENQLFRNYFPKETIITLGPPLYSSMPLAALDADGRVIGATYAARQQMNWHDHQISKQPVLMTLLDAQEKPCFRKAEEHVIRSALAANNRNVSAAARSLGISRSTLHRKIKILGRER